MYLLNSTKIKKMKKFLLSMCALALCGASVFAQGTLTVADNQATNSKVPINTLWYESVGTISQVIYPAEMLEDLQGTKITALKFYVSGNGERRHYCSLHLPPQW